MGNLKEGRQILQDALGDKDNPTSSIDSDPLSDQDLDGNLNKQDYSYGEVSDSDLDASKAGTSGDLNLSAQISYNIGVMRSKKGTSVSMGGNFI